MTVRRKSQHNGEVKGYCDEMIIKRDNEIADIWNDVKMEWKLDTIMMWHNHYDIQ